MLTKDKKICVSISILLLKLTRKILKHYFLEEMGGGVLRNSIMASIVL